MTQPLVCHRRVRIAYVGDEASTAATLAVLGEQLDGAVAGHVDHHQGGELRTPFPGLLASRQLPSGRRLELFLYAIPPAAAPSLRRRLIAEADGLVFAGAARSRYEEEVAAERLRGDLDRCGRHPAALPVALQGRARPLPVLRGLVGRILKAQEKADLPPPPREAESLEASQVVRPRPNLRIETARPARRRPRAAPLLLAACGLAMLAGALAGALQLTPSQSPERTSAAAAITAPR